MWPPIDTRKSPPFGLKLLQVPVGDRGGSMGGLARRGPVAGREARRSSVAFTDPRARGKGPSAPAGGDYAGGEVCRMLDAMFLHAYGAPPRAADHVCAGGHG